MKTKILSIAAVLMFVATLGFAKDPQTELNKTISSKITYPEKAKENQIEGVVSVEFTVNKDGKLEITKCFSEKGELQVYVFNTLYNLTIDPSMAEEGKVYSIEFEFKLL